ncbi:MAG: hypothetical protein Q8P50_00090 [Bacillota bacterium]|nr:hypothetical protein [Bacillota bacterium]
MTNVRSAAGLLRKYREAASDYRETCALRDDIASALLPRKPRYLTYREFDRVVRWKLKGQNPRTARQREPLTDEVVIAVTKAALDIHHSDQAYCTRVKLGILQSLPGVGMGIASAVLALVEPRSYGVIDFMVWDQLFGEERLSFSHTHYENYLTCLRALAEELAWTVQEVDLALWARAEAKQPALRLSC